MTKKCHQFSYYSCNRRIKFICLSNTTDAQCDFRPVGLGLLSHWQWGPWALKAQIFDISCTCALSFSSLCINNKIAYKDNFCIFQVLRGRIWASGWPGWPGWKPMKPKVRIRAQPYILPVTNYDTFSTSYVYFESMVQADLFGYAVSPGGREPLGSPFVR